MKLEVHVHPDVIKKYATERMLRSKQSKYVLPGDNGPPARSYNAVAALRPLEKYLARKRALTNTNKKPTI